jgi:hypothetical protein
MTALLQQAFDEASKRSQEEQDILAARLLAGLAADSAFDRAIDASAEKLAVLARQALAEHKSGQSEEFRVC